MRKLIVGVIFSALAVLAWGQGVVFFNTGTTMAVVDTNSTLLQAANNGGGQGRVHYDLIENRGTNNIIFDFTAVMVSTNVVIDGVTNAVFVGHLLRPLDTYELPAEKEYNGAIAAISTNPAHQGLVSLTVSHNQN